MADGETGNPFVDRMRRLDSEAMVGIEGTYEQSVKHLRKLNAQRVDELVEENTRRLALIESTPVNAREGCTRGHEPYFIRNDWGRR